MKCVSFFAGFFSIIFTEIPIPVSTVQGSGILMAFRPDRAEYGGIELDILVALSDKPLAQALLPPAALPDILA